jgi:hypothetical protein
MIKFLHTFGASKSMDLTVFSLIIGAVSVNPVTYKSKKIYFIYLFICFFQKETISYLPHVEIFDH